MLRRAPSPAVVTGLFLTGIAICALTVVTTCAAYRVTEIDTLRTVQCDRESREVFVSVGADVFVLGEDGATRLVLHTEPPFELVSDVDRLPEGGYAVAEMSRHAIYFFDEAGRLTDALEAPELFTLSFEVHPLDDGRLLTMDGVGGRLRVIDRAGNVAAERETCRHPNGLRRLPDGTFFVLCTNDTSLMAFDADLKDVALRAGTALKGFADVRGFGRGGLEVAVAGDGRVYMDWCRAGVPCEVYAYDDAAFALSEPVTWFGRLGLPSTDWTLAREAQSGYCVTSRGTIIAASSAFVTLVEFSDGRGGPPPPVDAADGSLSGVSLRDGQRVGATFGREFGDLDVSRAIGTVRGSLLLFDRIERHARLGLDVILFALLGAWGIDRWLGGRRRASVIDALSARSRVVLDRLVKPERTILLVYLATSGAILAAAGVVGYVLIGGGGAVLAAAAAKTVIGRRVAAPGLIRRRSAGQAEIAFDVYLGHDDTAPVCVLGADERVLFASCRLPSEDWTVRDTAQGVAEELMQLPDDPGDVIDLLAHQLEMVVVTNRRIFHYSCGLLGRPIGLVRAFVRRSASKRRDRLQHASLCPRCGVGISAKRRCGHQRLNPRAAVLAGLLLPGAGHLVLGAYSRGRLFLMLFAALGLQAADSWLSVYFGVWGASLWVQAKQTALLGGFWLFVLFDLALTIRARRYVPGAMTSEELAGALEGAALAESPGIADEPVAHSEPARHFTRTQLGLRFGLLAAVLGVALGAYRLVRGGAQCFGSGNIEVERLVDPATAPRDPDSNVYSFATRDIPYVALARVRHTGNDVYAAKNTAAGGHIHQPVALAMRRVGANGFFHETKRERPGAPDGERWQITSTAVVAHVGHVSEEQRARYLPAGRGCLLTFVGRDSVAERAGLRAGQVVVRVDDRLLRDRECRLTETLNRVPRGNVVELGILRDGAERTVRMRRPDEGLYGFNVMSAPILEQRR